MASDGRAFLLALMAVYDGRVFAVPSDDPHAKGPILI